MINLEELVAMVDREEAQAGLREQLSLPIYSTAQHIYLTELPPAPVLSIAQPWSYFVTHRVKTLECRNWWPVFQGQSYHRGDRWRFYIHAPQPKRGQTAFYNSLSGRFVRSPTQTINGRPVLDLLPEDFPFPECLGTMSGRDHVATGAIVGIATLVAVVNRRETDSPWFQNDNRFGFVLEDAMPLPPFTLKGQLGFFPVDEGPMIAHYRYLSIQGRWNWTN